MKIIIKETGAVETLNLIDSQSGCNWIADLVGNHDGFGDDPEKGFVKEFDEDGYCTGRYITSQANFCWWKEVVSGLNDVNTRISNLKAIVGTDCVDEIVYAANYDNSDLEYYADTINRYLDLQFGADAGR